LIFVDTNVVSETLLIEHDAELALPTVTIAEISYGTERIRPDERGRRQAEGLGERRVVLRRAALSSADQLLGPLLFASRI
jgi:predicted nucleic acid-binding protein